MARAFYLHTTDAGDNLKLENNIRNWSYDIYVNDEFVVGISRDDIGYKDALDLMFDLYDNTDYFDSFKNN